MSMFPIPEVGFNGGTTVERGAQTIAHVAGWQMDGAGAIYDDTGGYVGASLTEVGAAMVKMGFTNDWGSVFWGELDDFVQDQISLPQYTWKVVDRGGKTTAAALLGTAVARTVGDARRALAAS